MRKDSSLCIDSNAGERNGKMCGIKDGNCSRDDDSSGLYLNSSRRMRFNELHITVSQFDECDF